MKLSQEKEIRKKKKRQCPNGFPFHRRLPATITKRQQSTHDTPQASHSKTTATGGHQLRLVLFLLAVLPLSRRSPSARGNPIDDFHDPLVKEIGELAVVELQQNRGACNTGPTAQFQSVIKGERLGPCPTQSTGWSL